MAFVCVDKNVTELISNNYPYKDSEMTRWSTKNSKYVELPKGTIKKLIGRDLIFDDDPVELT